MLWTAGRAFAARRLKPEKVSIVAGVEATLEVRLLAGEGGGGVIITHPHPLFGGNMDNHPMNWPHSLDTNYLAFNMSAKGTVLMLKTISFPPLIILYSTMSPILGRR